MVETREAEEFGWLLARLGWSRGELARRLDLHPNTVSRWSIVPGYALAYLRLAVMVVAAAEMVSSGGRGDG